MTWTLSVLLLAVMALATPHSQASPSVDAGEPLGDYGTDQWWSSPPPVALQCCRLSDKGLDPLDFDLHHLLHHLLCSSLFWYWKGQGSSSANLQKKINCNMRKMASKDSKNANTNDRRKNVENSDWFVWDERNSWCCQNCPLKVLMITKELLNYIRTSWEDPLKKEATVWRSSGAAFHYQPDCNSGTPDQTPAREWAPFKVCGK